MACGRCWGGATSCRHSFSRPTVNPEITGDLKLLDVETGIPQDVTIDVTCASCTFSGWKLAGGDRGVLRPARDYYVAVDTGTPWRS